MTSAESELQQKLIAAVESSPSKMTLQLAREFGVPEVEVIRAFPRGRATELDVTRWEDILRRLEAFGNVHVIVSNGAATIEAIGQFANFSTSGEFFNVQSKTLDMHIRFGELGAIFAVEKPSHMSGINTLSFQFYDRRGDAVMKVFLTFGQRQPEAEVVAQFGSLRDSFTL